MALNPAPIQQPALEGNIFTQVWIRWFSNLANVTRLLRADGTIEAVQLADADAENNSIYYSTDSGKLVFKDLSGTVNALY